MVWAPSTPPRFATLVLLTWLAVLSLNMFLPSLPAIASELGVDYAVATLSIGLYLVIVAVLQILVGPLSDRYGRRPVLIAVLCVFVIASIGCYLARDMTTFLTFRLLQGVVVTGWMLSLAIIRDTVPVQEAASRIAYITMAMAIAPMVGPMLGGLLDQFFGWRSSFLFYAIGGMVVLVLVIVDLGETRRKTVQTLSDLMTAYSDLLRSRLFWAFSLCMGLSTGTFHAFLAGAPIMAGATLSLTTATLGFAMGTITAGFMFGSFLSGRLARYQVIPTMMIAGRIVACAGPLAGLVLLLAGYANAFTLFGAAVFVGIGNGLTMPSANAGALSVRPDLAGSASGLAGAATASGGAILSSVAGVVVTEANAATAFLALLFSCALAGLVAAIWVRSLSRL